MRKVNHLAREVLDIAAAAIQPGITTNAIDEIIHKACIERDSFPSYPKYSRFPNSLCTTPNEVICHGIPDNRLLLNDGILNLDESVYHDVFHDNPNETNYVGPSALRDRDSIRVVECTRQCLASAIEIVKPGMAF